MNMIKKQVLVFAAGFAILSLLIPASSAFYMEACGQDPVRSDVPDKDRGADPQKSPQPAKKPTASPQPSYKAEDWTVAFYPILAWAPVLGASINLPDLPDLPSRPPGADTGGHASGGLNGAAFFGLSVQKSRFVADFSVLWASVGAESTNPKVKIDTGAVFADAMAGVKIYRNLAVTAGVRHMGLKIDAKLGDRPGVTWKPGIWDPMIGLQLRSSLNRKWGVDLRFEGGGFGVGSDVDISATGRFDWRFARHFGMTMGYGLLHFKFSRETNTLIGTFTRETSQTLHGPILGFGIYF